VACLFCLTKVKNTRCIRSSRPDPDYAIFLPQIVSLRIRWWVSNTVSKGRTLRCGVRYTRKKLPVAFLRAGVKRASWDVSLFKTPGLARQFLRRNRSPSGFPVLPESPMGEYSIGCLAKEASTDRSFFVAITAWPEMTNSEDYAGSI